MPFMCSSFLADLDWRLRAKHFLKTRYSRHTWLDILQGEQALPIQETAFSLWLLPCPPLHFYSSTAQALSQS